MDIKTFKTFITEGFSAGDMEKAQKMIVNVLARKVGKKFNRFPGIEEVTSGGVKKQGLRYFLGGTLTSVRFNWTSSHGKEIESIDIWDGSGNADTPSINIDCRGASVAKIIPKIAEIIKSPSSISVNQEIEIITEMARPMGDLKTQFLNLKGVTLAKFNKNKSLQNEWQRWQRQQKKVGLGGSGPAEPTENLTKSKIKVTKGKKEVVSEDPSIAKAQKVLDKLTPDEMFSDLVALSRMVITGKAPSLIVTGMAGSGKTFEIQTQIKKAGLSKGSDWYLQKGNSSPFGLYSTLYLNRNKLIVFDDCDSVFGDAVSSNILKAALDSYDVREVSWTSKQTIPKEMFDADPDRYLSPEKGSPQYPDNFEFTGRIIFISNLPQSKIEPAILSRSYTIDISMTKNELVDRMQAIIDKIMPEVSVKDKQEVLDYMKENSNKFASGETNMRTFINSIKLQQCDPNWRKLAERYA